MVDLSATRPGVLVDEPDERDPVLGMLLDLARDELPDVAGAEDDASGRTRGPLGKRSDDHAPGEHERECERPESDQRRDLGVRKV